MQAIHILAFAATALVASPALAERALVSDTGAVYAEKVSHSASRLTTRSETILLTEACTAEIPGRGRGNWWWTDRGTTVSVGNYAVRFSDDVPFLSLSRCVG
ncbi:hypothetical protein SAMN04488020_10484 [Palleronia marisminoris]|uniref:Uncharacterized protein n=1 Tax=Palleronia marisminoris TaxID=315423 RepID=A0A1Y5SGH2_9RHOB|nr:hypothetical protein [Palleronia marisminoris]SFG81499.1 hypothetical protein SAMN04488020_10484 [Palleronia marisminoris]SLN40140.1 hypothetical protein PAM7066_01707 [Palleronia marisminoris]